MWSCSGYRTIGGKMDRDILFGNTSGVVNAAQSLSKGLKIWTGTVVVKNNVFNNPNFLFNIEFSNSEDREVWLKLCCSYPCVGYVNEVLARYRMNADISLTSRAFHNSNFSFLSLKERIEEDLKLISIEDQNAIENYIQSFNRKALLLLWLNRDLFKNSLFHFERYMDKEFINLLKDYNFLPKVLKKIFIRLSIGIRI